jgi:PAS domain S-box-containing protein
MRIVNDLNENRLFRLIFENLYEGAIITDNKGYILFFNKPYGEFLGVDPQEQIGKHCTEIFENSRMHIVGKTGEAEVNHIVKIKGQNMVVQRIPIEQEGKIVAVFGQVKFYDVHDVGELARTIFQLESKVKHYEQELAHCRAIRYTINSIISTSEKMNALKSKALKAALTQHPVLLYGESGTGKELFAQAIHLASHRRDSPFVRINCGAIPKELVESELFGYEKGAFTGAHTKGKSGKFELAHNGTIFLDEIGELPLDIQPTLLNVLEEKMFERVGGISMIYSDFRVIAATNQNLEQMVEEKKFREDLFYRLNVIPIYIPPLRDRREDILPLFYHFMHQMIEEPISSEIVLSQDAQDILENYSWPGNAREVKNIVERIFFALEKTDVIIHAQDLPPYMLRHQIDGIARDKISLKHLHASVEKDMICHVLQETNHNKTDAAKKLGIHRTHLYKKLKKYNLS